MSNLQCHAALGANPARRSSYLARTCAILLTAVMAFLTVSLVPAAYTSAEAAVSSSKRVYNKDATVSKKTYRKAKYKKRYTKKKKYSKKKYYKKRSSKRYAKKKWKKRYGKKRYSKKRYGKKRYSKKRYAKKRYSKKRRYAKKRYSKKRYAKRYSKKRYTKRKSKKTYAKKKYAKSGVKRSGGVRWVASSSCLNGRLRSIINQVAANYGSVTVSSTCRSRKRNARVGGAKRSHHLTGNAVDFRVHGRWGAAWAYLKRTGGIGGYKHYGGGLFHIDTGPRRTW